MRWAVLAAAAVATLAATVIHPLGAQSVGGATGAEGAVTAGAAGRAPTSGRVRKATVARERRSVAADVAPRTLVLRGASLVRARERLRAGDARLRPALDQLVADARAAMSAGPFSVTQKRRRAPSGDPHDYASTAPYWWPDSTKPDGLPYVQRDGQVNPESRADSDSPRFYALVDAVEALALAHWFTGERAYAERAGVLLRAWFLDPATRMNPHLDYAQGIPGRVAGRGIGIIDTRDLGRVADVVALLDGAPGWRAADAAGMRAWAAAYLRWLQESPNGKDERDEANNHGTWYDLQVAALALWTGDRALARRTIAESATSRLTTQVDAEGRQPLELRRTRPMHYAIFNLDPFERLAELGRHVGVDLWTWRAPNGATLRAAARWVAQRADSAVPRPGPETIAVPWSDYALPIRRALAAFPDDSVLRAGLAALPADVRARDRSALLQPEADGSPNGSRGAPSGVAATADSLDALAERALAFAEAQYRRSAATLDPKDGWPRFTRPDGTWERRGPVSWTNGFYPGTLWLLYERTRDPFFRAQAARWTAGLDTMARVTHTHDLGFVLFDSFGQQWRLTGDPRARAVLLEGAATLARRWRPQAGVIQSWDVDTVRDGRNVWRGTIPVIVDNLMNLELLFWAAANGGDPGLKALAARHARTSLAAHVRDDGSVAHVALFDRATGAMLRRATWQGHADTSAWARGQAWAIYGLAEAHRNTGDPTLLAGARRAADWFLAHLPADGVPPWDFRLPPGAPAERDASASAVAASGLLDLARRVEPAAAARYRTAAERMLAALCRDHLAVGTNSPAILRHSVGGRPQGDEVDVGITYADYYFVEALLRRRGLAFPAP